MGSKKLILTVLIFTITLLLSGCSNDNKTFNTAIEKLQNAQSYRVEYDYNIVSTNELFEDMQIKMEVDMNSEDEFASKIEMEVSGQKVEAYIISENDDNAAFYMKMNILGQDYWFKQTQGINELFEENDINNMSEDDLLNQLYENTNIEVLEDEEIDGITYKKFDVQINMSEFYEDYLPFDETYTSEDPYMADYLDSVENTIKELFSEFNMIVYINPEEETVYRIDVDLTDAMNSIYEDIVETGIADTNYKPIITSLEMSMVFDKFNEIEVVLPEEANNAMDMSDLD